MLKDVSKHLSKRVKTLSVVGRTAAKMSSLSECLNLNPILVDYTKDHFEGHIQTAINQFGPLDLVVAWIHGSAPNATNALANVLYDQKGMVKYFDLKGSSVANPNVSKSTSFGYFEKYPTVKYHQVILGFVRENNSSRWLSHTEISNGVIKAIESDKVKHIVGQVEPWNQRP